MTIKNTEASESLVKMRRLLKFISGPGSVYAEYAEAAAEACAALASQAADAVPVAWTHEKALLDILEYMKGFPDARCAPEVKAICREALTVHHPSPTTAPADAYTLADLEERYEDGRKAGIVEAHDRAAAPASESKYCKECDLHVIGPCGSSDCGMRNPAPASESIPESLIKRLSDWITQNASDVGYGFHRPANPHDFTPDAECCSEDEIAAHKAACEAFDKGEYAPEHRSGWVGEKMHVLTAPWGIGSYYYIDDEAAKLVEELTHTAAQVAAIEEAHSKALIRNEMEARHTGYIEGYTAATVEHNQRQACIPEPEGAQVAASKPAEQEELIDEASGATIILSKPAEPVFNHPDDSAVDRFAAAMRAKMAAQRAKGYGGWDNEALCTDESLADKLMRHTQKGDPVDVANFCMMLHQRHNGDTYIVGDVLRIAALDFAKRVASAFVPDSKPAAASGDSPTAASDAARLPVTPAPDCENCVHGQSFNDDADMFCHLHVQDVTEPCSDFEDVFATTPAQAPATNQCDGCAAWRDSMQASQREATLWAQKFSALQASQAPALQTEPKGKP